MASSRKRGKLKGWLSGLFSAKDESTLGRHHPVSSGAVFGQPQDVALHAAAATSEQDDHHIMSYIASLLSQHVIRGATHDSSARTPPPRCHPKTRIKLIARITAWFEEKGQQELVLWLTGPAGVGKSAIMQTFAEYLAKLDLLGATIFFSRANKRHNPHGVFITIAYQFASRIDSYRNYMVERLTRDPELLNGDLQAQFNAFIVEPFVEKKIGATGQRWGILLDGLDELRGEDAQCEIIQLISTFAYEHPDAPLAWIIASRPEMHISNTFDDDDVRHSCWSEHIPIDSTEACEDVERFIRSSFKKIQKKFRRFVPHDWPSGTEFLKVTAAASGLFIYAEVVMQFIIDANFADPVSRLKVLLSIIDHSGSLPTKENPFIHLDALYHQILSSIPPNLWLTTKRLLGFVNRQGHIFNCFRANELGTLRGMSLLFGLSPHVIYMCIIKFHSTLRVPDWNVAHKQPLGFLHGSFADYLKDPNRSGEFYIGSDQDVDDDIASSLLEIWNQCSEDDVGTVENSWHRYCSQWEDRASSRAITKFHTYLFSDVIYCLSSMLQYMFKSRAQPPVFPSPQLHKLHMIKLSYYLQADDIAPVVDALVTTEVNDTNLLRRIRFKDLTFGHLDSKMMCPIRVYYGTTGTFSRKQWILNRPRSMAILENLASELEFFQKCSPELEIIIFGSIPEERVAVLRHPLKNDSHYYDFMYYIIPYPE